MTMLIALRSNAFPMSNSTCATACEETVCISRLYGCCSGDYVFDHDFFERFTEIGSMSFGSVVAPIPWMINFVMQAIVLDHSLLPGRC